MKKLILCLTLMAFGLVAYADDAKAAKETKATKEKESAGCCSAAKATSQAKSACTETAKAKTADCGSCCKETPVKRTALLSPKAAAERGL
jgi:hypothetical protein